MKSFTCPPPARAGHAHVSLSPLFSCSTLTLFYLVPPLPFRTLFLFCCQTPDLSTISALAPPPLVLAEAAAAAVFALAPPPLVLADTAAVAVFALAPLPLVLAEAAAAAVFTPAPQPLVLAEAAAAAVFAPAPHPVVLAQGLAGLLGCGGT